jgi:ATPase family AAA domain-containing protein 3A/B
MQMPRLGGSSAAQAAAPAADATAGGDISGKFDPTALERGAKALKELDGSANAKYAFEVIKMQEATKQKEMSVEAERLATERSNAGIQRAQVEGEQKRKTESHKAEEERRTSQYKTKLESELYQKKLEDQQKQNEQWLEQQHQQFLEHERLRRQNEEEMEEKKRKSLEHQMQLQRQNDIARAGAEGEARTKQERENIDVRIREMKAKAQEDYRTRIDSITTTLNSVGGALNTLLSDPRKLMWTVGGLTAVALGVYTAKNATRVAANLAEKRLGRPSLVRETSRMKLDWKGTVDKFLGRHKPFAGLDNIVLNKHLSERLGWTSNALINTKKSGTPFQHLMLYGPPWNREDPVCSHTREAERSRLRDHDGRRCWPPGKVSCRGDQQIVCVGRYEQARAHPLYR